jgi:hypothetical protein
VEKKYYPIPDALWHRIQGFEQTKNPGMQLELVTAAAVCLGVPRGYHYEHAIGAFVPERSGGVVSLDKIVGEAVKRQATESTDEASGKEQDDMA